MALRRILKKPRIGKPAAMPPTGAATPKPLAKNAPRVNYPQPRGKRILPPAKKAPECPVETAETLDTESSPVVRKSVPIATSLTTVDATSSTSQSRPLKPGSQSPSSSGTSAKTPLVNSGNSTTKKPLLMGQRAPLSMQSKKSASSGGETSTPPKNSLPNSEPKTPSQQQSKPLKNKSTNSTPSTEIQTQKSQGVLFTPRVGGPLGSAASHLVIDALAGTGKTFTVIEGAKRIMTGRATTGVKGTPQQEAVWQEMTRGSKPESIHFAAFGKAIATELTTKVPKGVTVSTLHSLGMRLLKQAGFRANFERNKTSWMLEDMMELDIRQIRQEYKKWVPGLCRVVELCKMNMVTFDGLSEDELAEKIGTMIAYFDVDLPDTYFDMTLEWVPKLLERSKLRTDIIDHADMIWMPNVLSLRPRKYGMMIIDERQDLNVAQQELGLRAAHRFVLCGDENQAIFGFAGADADACARMNSKLQATALGARIMPLTVTRRCCQAVVRYAQEIVPGLEAMPDAPEGVVDFFEEDKEGDTFRELVTDGGTDMIICRTNAPLVSHAMRLIRRDRKANIQGRDIGDGLIDTIDDLHVSSVLELQERLDDHYQQQMERLARKKYVSEATVVALQDTVDSLKSFCVGSKSITEIKTRIKSLFTDENTDGILLSSIHRAKGLERPTIHFIREDTCPHPMARTPQAKKQEWNLRYVGITRAMTCLNMVKSPPKPKKTREEYED